MRPDRSRSAIRAASRFGAMFMLIACEREFPVTRDLVVTMETVNWPDTLTVTDTAELSVRIVAADGRVVTGAVVSWTSSDPSILDVSPIVPTGGGSFDSLSARLRVRARAKRIGDVLVTALVEEGGALQRSVLVQMINVQARWISVSAGYQHSCGVTVTNDAYCWGEGAGLRLLGNGSSAGSLVPARVVGSLPFAIVSAGDEHSCGTVLDGLMYCWGYNPAGGLGINSTQDQLAPGPVALGPRFKTFGAGKFYTCGVSDINTAVCWGDNSSGQLSTAAAHFCGSQSCSLVPVVVADASGAPFVVSQIAPGETSTCALDLTGSAYCWGDNYRGMLGTGAQASSVVPRPVASTGKFRSIGVSGHHGCAIAMDGRAWCWGTNLFGELGVATTVDTCDNLPCTRAPVQVSGSVLFRAVSVRGRSSCAITAGGEVWCWGLNDHGQLGSTTTESCAGRACSTAPRRVEGGLLFTNVSVGKSHVCGLARNGGAYCWGQQADRALGTTSTDDALRPRRVASPRS